jgi:hypothetical protein
MSDKHYESFEDFWPDYVRAHTNKTNRRLHFIGSSLALACVGGAALLRRPSLLLAAPVFGYGFAWVGHFVFEGNKPASFEHPLYSFKADWIMYGKIAKGTMDAEVEKYSSHPPVEPHGEAAQEGRSGAAAANATANATAN